MFFAVSLNIMWSDLGVNMKECPHLNTHLNGRKLPKRDFIEVLKLAYNELINGI